MEAIHTEKQGEAGAGICSGCTSMADSSGGFVPRLPGPSSALEASDHLHSEGPQRCPSQHGIHHSYSDVHSPGGRSSTQIALAKWGRIGKLLIKFEHTTTITCRPPSITSFHS